MKRSQRIILSLGLVILAASALFPPLYGYYGQDRRALGRRFLATQRVRPMSIDSTRKSRRRVGKVEFDIPRMLGEWVIIGSGTALGVLLAPQVLSLPATILANRRRKRGQCLSCGYSLTGNESGVCPECGRKIKPLTEED